MLKIAGFRLLKKIAAGGMAELYTALPDQSSPQPEQAVVVKRLLPELASDHRFCKMFQHEAQIMAAMRHPNLLRVYAYHQDGQEHIIVMEHIRGCDLATIIAFFRHNKIHCEPSLATWIAREVCSGLDYVHNLNDTTGRPLQVVHRDMTPGNILFTLKGEVKLGDFGIAKSTASEIRTQTGQIKGNLYYLSPEQAASDRITHLSDIFGVGLLLFELLTNQRYNTAKGELSVLKRAIQPRWRPITQHQPRVPKPLCNIVQRALRPEPETRHGSASVLAAALSQVLNTMPILPDQESMATVVETVLKNKPDIPAIQTTKEANIEADPEQDNSFPHDYQTKKLLNRQQRAQLLAKRQAAQEKARKK